MNSIGKLFRISLFGESHGMLVGVIIDGCPAGLPLCCEDLIADILRRKSGKLGTTPRREQDTPILMSGVFKGKTTGAPIIITFKNANIKSKDYENLKYHPRPGHADFVSIKKYGGYNDYRGGGYFSGRLTLGMVAAGVIAKKLIPNIFINAKLIEVGGSKNIEKEIKKVLAANDSVGGLIECKVIGVPIGLGEPFFDSLHARLAQIIFSIPAIKGLEFGAGFTASRMYGSQHNDCLINEEGTTSSNNSGGINGGISNGNPLRFKIAVKPPSSIGLSQITYNFKNNKQQSLKVEGRHDACIALRIPPVLEAATALVLVDLMLQEQKIPRVLF